MSTFKKFCMTFSSSGYCILIIKLELLSDSSLIFCLYFAIWSFRRDMCFCCSALSPSIFWISSSRCSIYWDWRVTISVESDNSVYNLLFVYENYLSFLVCSRIVSSLFNKSRVSFSTKLAASEKASSSIFKVYISSSLLFNFLSSRTDSFILVALCSSSPYNLAFFYFSSLRSLSSKLIISLSVAIFCYNSSFPLPVPRICAFLSWVLAASSSPFSF